MTHLRDLLTYFIMWSSITVFCYTLFRFRLQAYRPQLFFTMIILTHTGYVVPLLGLESLRPLIYTVIMLCCMILFFRLHWLHAAVMVMATYAVCTFSVSAIKMLLAGWNYDAYLQLVGPLSSRNRVIFAVYMYLLTWFTYQYRLGFTFIPSYPAASSRGPVPLWMKITIGLGTGSIAVRILSFFAWKDLVPFDFVVVSLLCIVLFYLFYKKETSE